MTRHRLSSCDQHLPRASLLYIEGMGCPLCEALEVLVVAKVKPEGRGDRLVRESFRVSRAATLGGYRGGEG